MSDALYQVLVIGQAAQTPARQAIGAFAQLFCVSVEEAAARFADIPFIVRGHLSRDQAEKYCRVLRRSGILCELREQRDQQPPSGSLYPRLSLSALENQA